MKKDKFYKILFRQLDEDKEIINESIWAKKVGDNFQVENIPFYIKSVSFKDIVKVELIKEELIATEIIKESGHSTIRIYFDKQFKEIDAVRKKLEKMGCGSEVSHNPRIVAIDIPVNIKYNSIREYLDIGEKKNFWEYEEGCLAHTYVR